MTMHFINLPFTYFTSKRTALQYTCTHIASLLWIVWRSFSVILKKNLAFTKISPFPMTVAQFTYKITPYWASVDS